MSVYNIWANKKMSSKQLQLNIVQFADNSSKNLKNLQGLSSIIEAYQKKPNQIEYYSEFQQTLKDMFDSFEENQLILRTIYEKGQQVDQSDVETVENQELIVEKSEKLNIKLPIWIARAQEILVLQNFIKRKIQAESLKKWPLELDELLQLSILYKYNIVGFKKICKQEILSLFQ